MPFCGSFFLQFLLSTIPPLNTSSVQLFHHSIIPLSIRFPPSIPQFNPSVLRTPPSAIRPPSSVHRFPSSVFNPPPSPKHSSIQAILSVLLLSLCYFVILSLCYILQFHIHNNLTVIPFIFHTQELNALLFQYLHIISSPKTQQLHNSTLQPFPNSTFPSFHYSIFPAAFRHPSSVITSTLLHYSNSIFHT